MLLHAVILLLYAAPFYFVFSQPLLFAQFCFGLLCGFGIFSLDRILHILFLQPEGETSQQIRIHWRNKKFADMVKVFLQAKHQEQELVTRSVLFFFVYVGLAIYVLTSTGNVLGMGLILGIGLHFCIDFWRYQRDEEKFRQLFLWQLKRRLNHQEIKYLVIIFSLFFALLSMLMIPS